MSYITYDPTNIAEYENSISTQQKKESQVTKWILLGTVTVFIIYIFLWKPEKDKDEQRIF